jgi:outer membrane protein TolC
MAATRVALVSARSDVVNGRTTLATLIAVPRVDGPLSYTFGEDLSATAPLAPVEAFEDKALTSREDVVAAQAAIRAAEQGVREAVAQYYPSVNLNLTGFLYRENFDDASKWTAVLNANLPIFTAGQIEADVRRAWSVLRQAALFESLTRRDALQGVRLAYENVTASRQRIADLETQVQAAREALEQAEGSYRVGLATNLERLAAQSALLSAELQLTSERFDQALLVLDLTRFTGRLGSGGTLLRVSGTLADTSDTLNFRTSDFVGNTSTSNGGAGIR